MKRTRQRQQHTSLDGCSLSMNSKRQHWHRRSQSWLIGIGWTLVAGFLVVASCGWQSPVDVVVVMAASSSLDIDLIHNNAPRHLQSSNGSSSSGSFTDGEDNTSSAYLKCFSLLDELDTSEGELNQDNYLKFLDIMTNGAMQQYEDFASLPVLFVMIFYTAACIAENDCQKDTAPRIIVGDTKEPSDVITLFCKQILKSTVSMANVSFEYTVQYDTNIISETELADCLANATVNVLLEQLANCPVSTNATTTPQSRKALSSLRQTDRHHRQLQLGSASSEGVVTNCPYSIFASVDRINELCKWWLDNVFFF